MGSKLGGTLFALVFLITFGGVGFGASWGIVSMFRDSFRADDWVLVQAKVDDTALNSIRGSKGGTSYEAEGAYRYTVGGKQYVSRQLGFSLLGGSDNIGDWQESMAAFLQEAKEKGKTIPVYVNPDNPAEAVVDRDVRWALVLFMAVFAVVFGGVGVGALIGIGVIWFGKNKSKAGKRAIRQHAAERNRAAVAGARSATVASAASGVGMLWVFALFWNAIAFPAAILVIPQILESGEWAGLLILIFPFVGLLVLWGAIAQTIGLLRRGKPALALEPAEPTQGRRFSGVVRYARGVKPGEEFVVRLSGFEFTRDNSSAMARWWKDLPVRAVADPAGGARVPFQFDPPARVSGSRPNDKASDGLQWSLSVQRKRGGLGTGDNFPIEMRPAPDLTEDTPPALPTAEERRNMEMMAKLLGADAAAKLTPELRASFAQMDPKSQALAGKVVANAGLIKKVFIGIVVLFFAYQIIGAIVAILSS